MNLLKMSLERYMYSCKLKDCVYYRDVAQLPSDGQMEICNCNVYDD